MAILVRYCRLHTLAQIKAGSVANGKYSIGGTAYDNGTLFIPSDGGDMFMFNGTAIKSVNAVHTKADIGLGKVENLTKAEILASAALTGTPTTPAPTGDTGVANKKYVDDTVNTMKTSLGTVYNYKGSVATKADLPTSAKAGDVYNVVAADGNTPAGTNYAKTADGWDALGGTLDLSAYSTTEQMTAAIAVETDRATTAEETLTTNLTAEVNRAKAAEKDNADAITAETSRATGAEGTLTTNLANEVTRAKAAEKANADAAAANATAISTEQTRATGKEAELQTAINGKEPTLTDEQHAAINSGITAEILNALYWQGE